MKIIIKDSNEAKITAAIKEAEGPNSRYIVKLTDEAKDAIIKACSAFFR